MASSRAEGFPAGRVYRTERGRKRGWGGPFLLVWVLGAEVLRVLCGYCPNNEEMGVDDGLNWGTSQNRASCATRGTCFGITSQTQLHACFSQRFLHFEIAFPDVKTTIALFCMYIGGTAKSTQEGTSSKRCCQRALVGSSGMVFGSYLRRTTVFNHRKRASNGRFLSPLSWTLAGKLHHHRRIAHLHLLPTAQAGSFAHKKAGVRHGLPGAKFMPAGGGALFGLMNVFF